MAAGITKWMQQVNSANTQFDVCYDITQTPKSNVQADYNWYSAVITHNEVTEYVVTIPWATLAQLGIIPGDTVLFNLASNTSRWDWSGLTGISYHLPRFFGELTLPELE